MPKQPKIAPDATLATAGADDSLVLTRFSDLKVTRPPYLWPGVLPHGLVLLAGDPGVSKSVLSIDWAARITTGRPWPDGKPNKVGSVVFLAAEDNANGTILPRFRAAGGDPARASLITRSDASVVSLRDDAQRLREVIRRVGDVRLIVIDPINSYLAGVNTWRDGEVREALHPLITLALESKATLLGIIHLTKGQGQKALYRVLGSAALPALSRAVWLVGKDPSGEEGRAVMAPLKFNLGRTPKSIGYRIKEVGQGRGRARQPVLEYLAFDLDTSAQELLMPVDRPKGSVESVHDAALRWLARTFAARRTIATAELKRLAAEAGFAWRAIERVKAEAGLRAFKPGKGWAHTIDPPEEAHTPAGDTTTKNTTGNECAAHATLPVAGIAAAMRLATVPANGHPMNGHRWAGRFGGGGG